MLIKIASKVSLVQSSIRYFQAYQDQFHPNEQPSSYPVICFPRNGLIQEVAQIQKVGFFRIDPLVPDHPQFHDDVKNFFLDIVIVIDNSVPIEFPHGEDTLNFLNNEEIFDSPSYSFFRYRRYRPFSGFSFINRQFFGNCHSS